MRGSDGARIAIQCKSRKLDNEGRGSPITKREIDSFSSISSSNIWEERWPVTNGDNPLGQNAFDSVPLSKPIKVFNIDSDLRKHDQAARSIDEVCSHCARPGEVGVTQTRTCMQTEAINTSLVVLRNHERSTSGGLPVGEARGRIVLPCGTGKTRKALRIVEGLTGPGQLAIVLCPSIALVAQIRREFLVNASKRIRTLSVCSDETASLLGRKKETALTEANPTLDLSLVSASEVKGFVTTDVDKIAEWICSGASETEQINVIFGTYQSSHKVGEALCNTGTTAKVLIADEAHRTAGLRKLKKLENRIRDFTVCHDNERFPVRFRVYQTATPRVYDTGKRQTKNDDWIVRNMDDETVFGVELFRKSYMEAVSNGWLTDYRIIALGVNDEKAYKAANELAKRVGSGRNALTTTHFLRGLILALVMGGATKSKDGAEVASCIGFMNTVAKSKTMADQLQSDTVRNWVKDWLNENREGKPAAHYTLEHLDASSNVTARENAKSRLATASLENPHGILNVGIFGEGTDAPSLSSVAFLEARKSPIDVIQAVGRAMRLSQGKNMGYIICPILIPPNVDAEKWLETSGPEDGWQELGQILRALRAHDSRIEDNLSELLKIYCPSNPETVSTIVAIAGEDRVISYHGHHGKIGKAPEDIQAALDGRANTSDLFVSLEQLETSPLPPPTAAPHRHQTLGSNNLFQPGTEAATDTTAIDQPNDFETQLSGQLSGGSAKSEDAHQTQDGARYPAPGTIITGKKNDDGSCELREDSPSRERPRSDGTPGPINIEKSKEKARNMINNGAGIPLLRKTKRTPKQIVEENALRLIDFSLAERGLRITANLLSKSGLRHNRVERDLNLLEGSITEASRHLRSDQLGGVLDKHFGLDNLDKKMRNSQADGCTIGALLLMNAAMLHQRIANGKWLPDLDPLAVIKNDAFIVRRLLRQWNKISQHDFLPIVKPAIEVIEAVEDSGKESGLERALRHLVSEAERIAETYADMGADHAGPLFNKVMGNQASDGAYFTRPVAASIAARIALDVCGDVDWSDPDVWRNYKTVDPACGSGTLLAAMLTEMKRRARTKGADANRLTSLQKIAVEETIKGLDINPVSLQLAASQLTSGEQSIRYRKMGLHLMPYGAQGGDPHKIGVGSLELLGQDAIVPKGLELRKEGFDETIDSRSVWDSSEDALLENEVEAVKDAQIVIMNPPFTNRTKMGEKFTAEVRQAMRSRSDGMERLLVLNDKDMRQFVDKNALRPMFVALADRCLTDQEGVLTMVCPTVALTATSGRIERIVLAQRFHIIALVTCHLPGQVNLSQNANINESIIVAKRHSAERPPPTKVINLDRMPSYESEVDDLHQCLLVCKSGSISNGWGEVSEWPAERIEEGDWTAAIWRSPELADAASNLAANEKLLSLSELGMTPAATGQQLRGSSYQRADSYALGSFPIIKSKGAEGQKRLRSTPDEYWVPKKQKARAVLAKSDEFQAEHPILQKAGYLLVTAGQDTSTGRLTSVASDKKYVGNGWMPIAGATPVEAKAISLFLNSTAGRMQIMRNPGRKLSFPVYSAAEVRNVRVPNIREGRILSILWNCWERTNDEIVPQFRDGECEIRRQWDEAVARALNWDPDVLAEWRHLLHREPHVRGLGYNQYSDARDKSAA